MKKLFACLLLIAMLFSVACNKEVIGSNADTEVDDTKVSTDISTSDEETTTGSPNTNTSNCDHTDSDNNGYCDDCGTYVIIMFDFFAINDLHGKFASTDSNSGVGGLTTYLKEQKAANPYTVLFSSGDMWQGSSESNLTQGAIVSEWMHELDFTSMTLGNHEYDWGAEVIRSNASLSDLPFLAINVYDRDTNERADYCEASVIVDLGVIQIGIIGAIGDCYSSISADKTDDVYFKTGNELTELVKDESERLRSNGVDYIIYSLHDGYESNSSSAKDIDSSELENYYSSELSRDGYVDIVFEGHTHKQYILRDSYGIYHMQNGGENKGISHASVNINIANYNSDVVNTNIVSSSVYSKYDTDSTVNELLKKYEDAISKSNEVLGNISFTLRSNQIADLVAKLYYDFGVEKWGDEYDIALGGGFLSVRSPYNIQYGEVKYSDLQAVLPFDNNLVLCSVKGRDLKNKFFESNNDRYHISYGEYGESIKDNIDPNATYYIVVDSYTSTYAPNNLTEIERIDEDIFARDLLAQYIKDGYLS